ncbi:hypothetical protein HAX54_038379 [Datura stramonium]|uniref:Uncharacterized protein n=1 Tax=Datura stramonium TaxID=4076 RepID=A0ABS8SIB5_DATST|nr:hypothetical protein [Datura stramonium]
MYNSKDDRRKEEIVLHEERENMKEKVVSTTLVVWKNSEGRAKENREGENLKHYSAHIRTAINSHTKGDTTGKQIERDTAATRLQQLQDQEEDEDLEDISNDIGRIGNLSPRQIADMKARAKKNRAHPVVPL